MIYSNKKLVTTGRLGTTKDYKFDASLIQPVAKTKTKTKAKASEETEQAKDPATYLGEVGGRSYWSFPDLQDMTQIEAMQDSEIDFHKELDLSNDIKQALRTQTTCMFMKQQARKEIEATVGDPLDQLAVTGQLVEFAVFGVCALMADKAGLVPMTEEAKQSYGQRGAAVMQYAESGELLLRASFESPEKMIKEILPKYSAMQKIVRDKYILPVKQLGLNLN